MLLATDDLKLYQVPSVQQSASTRRSHRSIINAPGKYCKPCPSSSSHDHDPVSPHHIQFAMCTTLLPITCSPEQFLQPVGHPILSFKQDEACTTRSQLSKTCLRIPVRRRVVQRHVILF